MMTHVHSVVYLTTLKWSCMIGSCVDFQHHNRPTAALFSKIIRRSPNRTVDSSIPRTAGAHDRSSQTLETGPNYSQKMSLQGREILRTTTTRASPSRMGELSAAGCHAALPPPPRIPDGERQPRSGPCSVSNTVREDGLTPKQGPVPKGLKNKPTTLGDKSSPN